MAAAITPGYAFSTTEQVTAAKLASLVSAGTISGIDQTNMASGSGVVITSSSAPSNTNAVWIDSGNSNAPKVYNGSAWVQIGSGAVPAQYRRAMYCMQASTTTMTVAPGVLEVNGVTITKTSNTTLTLGTAGDWAGGSSLRGTSTLGFIGVDASGNIKMHTTAPTHADYALSISAANNTKRYVSWASTTYRVIGWFYMNATGSGELDAFGVSNLADGTVKNVVEFTTGAVATGSTAVPNDDTIPQSGEGDQYMSQVFRPTNVNNKLKIEVVWIGSSDQVAPLTVGLFQDATASSIAVAIQDCIGSRMYTVPLRWLMKAATIALTTFKVRAGTSAGATTTFNGVGGARKFGGAFASSIRIEELEAELT